MGVIGVPDGAGEADVREDPRVHPQPVRIYSLRELFKMAARLFFDEDEPSSLLSSLTSLTEGRIKDHRDLPILLVVGCQHPLLHMLFR